MQCSAVNVKNKIALKQIDYIKRTKANSLASKVPQEIHHKSLVSNVIEQPNQPERYHSLYEINHLHVSLRVCVRLQYLLD